MEKGKLTYKLPEGWIWTTIGEIGVVQSGGTSSTRNKELLGDEISWITPADLSGYKGKYISKGNRSISKLGLDYSSAIISLFIYRITYKPKRSCKVNNFK
jgi:type I restriction enzyme, S subunit